MAAGGKFTEETVRVCDLDECNGKHYARGLCKKHHQRQWRHGTTEIVGRRYVKRPLADRVRELTAVSATSDGCLEWLGHRDRDGYGRLWFDDRDRPAIRATWIANRGPIPAGMVVRHKCDNPPCVNLDHLELGTNAENMRDKAIRGRAPSGTSNPAAKFTPEQVDQVRALRLEGLTLAGISEKTGVSKSQVARIIRGESRAS